MALHSSLLGGSIASRRLHCPASFREQLRAPPGTTSVYAEEGTRRHEMMAYWLANPDSDLFTLTVDGRAITADDIAALETAEDALHAFELYHGGGFQIIEQELQVQFPGVPGAFGTLDLVIGSLTHIAVIDFKFGAGVQVTAANERGEPNAQLMFYACGLPKKWIGGRTLVLAIIQPTFEPHMTHVVITPEQLKAFEELMQGAVAEALSHDPPRARGDWCRFAPCKVTCSLWTGPLLDLTAVGRPPVRDTRDHDEWGEYLANAKRLVDSAVMYQKQIDAALIDHLKAGYRAPGFALKPARTVRKWLDDVKHVAKALKKLGLKDAEIWQHKIQTFQVVDAAAKRRGKTVPDSLRPKPESTELALTSEDDPARINVGEQAALFRDRLKALIK
jgi:hypothetical protein